MPTAIKSLRRSLSLVLLQDRGRDAVDWDQSFAIIGRNEVEDLDGGAPGSVTSSPDVNPTVALRPRPRSRASIIGDFDHVPVEAANPTMATPTSPSAVPASLIPSHESPPATLMAAKHSSTCDTPSADLSSPQIPVTSASAPFMGTPAQAIEPHSAPSPSSDTTPNESTFEFSKERGSFTVAGYSTSTPISSTPILQALPELSPLPTWNTPSQFQASWTPLADDSSPPNVEDTFSPAPRIYALPPLPADEPFLFPEGLLYSSPVLPQGSPGIQPRIIDIRTPSPPLRQPEGSQEVPQGVRRRLVFPPYPIPNIETPAPPSQTQDVFGGRSPPEAQDGLSGRPTPAVQTAILTSSAAVATTSAATRPRVRGFGVQIPYFPPDGPSRTGRQWTRRAASSADQSA
ncbi:hypothetical protein P7C73_g4571, partial [Tremellales sp. Uapishka_1]